MKPLEVEKKILKNGWFQIPSSGSHRQYVHKSQKGRVTIPWHNKDLKIKTLKAIEKQSGIKLTR